MNMQKSKPCPSFNFPLRPDRPPRKSAEKFEPRLEEDYLTPLLPASFRTEADHIIVPEPNESLTTWLERELDVQRLHAVKGLLWFAGRPMPPRPLHSQQFRGRDILVTEQMDLHLVWNHGRIFIKPLSRFLLDPRFWQDYLCCGDGCSGFASAFGPANTCTTTPNGHGANTAPEACMRKGLRGRALGFLFSYTALISYESDFRLAQDKYLLPPELTWPAWRTFVREFNPGQAIYEQIHPRFHYGELRLSRLNKIYFFTSSGWFSRRSYIPRWRDYSTFLSDNFSWLSWGILFIGVAVAGMQTGLSTTSLADTDKFQAFCVQFALFSISAPPLLAAVIVLMSGLSFLYNCAITMVYRRQRMSAIAPGSVKV